jgi:hypothetical protein
MATAFQITSIIFIFSYSASPKQGEVKNSKVKTIQVSPAGQASNQNVIMQTSHVLQQAATISRSKAAEHNFSWRALQPEIMIGETNNPAKRNNTAPGVTSFANFTETVYR